MYQKFVSKPTVVQTHKFQVLSMQELKEKQKKAFMEFLEIRSQIVQIEPEKLNQIIIASNQEDYEEAFNLLSQVELK